MSFSKQPVASNFVHGVQLRALPRELETRRRKALLLLPHATRPPSQGWMNSSGYSEHPKISKSYQNQEIRSGTVQHGLYSQAWSIQPSTITTSTYLNHICMAKECKRELVQSNTPRFERTANTMEKQSQATGPVSRYLRESPASKSRAQSSTIDLLRTGKFSMIFNHVDKHMYLLVSHCHVTSCPTSLIRIPYIGSPQPLHFPHISTGDAQGPPCCSHPTVAMASALRPCPLAFHIMGSALGKFWWNPVAIYVYSSKLIYNTWFGCRFVLLCRRAFQHGRPNQQHCSGAAGKCGGLHPGCHARWCQWLNPGQSTESTAQQDTYPARTDKHDKQS